MKMSLRMSPSPEFLRACTLHAGPVRSTRCSRKQLLVLAKSTAIERADPNKGSTAAIVRETIISPFSAAYPVALAAAGYFAGYGVEGAYAGAAAGVALRGLQAVALEQTVPFTYRRHTVILPPRIENTMGEATYRQQVGRYQQAGRVLPESNRDAQLINQIASRIIKAVGLQDGGGFQSHVKDFQWTITVVNDKTPNAFVLPGGKIVVFTGLIDLLGREEDLLAAVIGHEVAHAVARHSTEKLTTQLLITLVLNVGLAIAQNYLSRRNGGRQQMGGGFTQRGAGAFGGQRRGGGGGGIGGLLLNPQVLSIVSNLFLQLPFSRRAEAEADLIGVKLMGLAGYDPTGAPETFRRLGQAESKMRAAMGGNLGALQCTHPRSETRVSLLEEELELMQEAGEAGKHRVLHSVPYWMLALVACVLVPGVSQVVV